MKNNILHIDTNNKALVEQVKVLCQNFGYNWPASLSSIKPNSWIKINLDTRNISPASTRSKNRIASVIATDLASIIPQLTKETVVVPASVAAPIPVTPPLEVTKPVITKPTTPVNITKPTPKAPVAPPKPVVPVISNKNITVPTKPELRPPAKPTITPVAPKSTAAKPPAPPLPANTVKKYPVTEPRSDHQRDGTSLVISTGV